MRNSCLGVLESWSSVPFIISHNVNIYIYFGVCVCLSYLNTSIDRKETTYYTPQAFWGILLYIHQTSNRKRAAQCFPLRKSCKIDIKHQLLSSNGLPRDAGRNIQVFPELTVTRGGTRLEFTPSDWHAVSADAGVTVCLPGLLLARLQRKLKPSLV